MKPKKIKLKAEGYGVKESKGYPLGVDVDVDCGPSAGHVGELCLIPPHERGECHCLAVVFEGEESPVELPDSTPGYLFMNMSTSALRKLAKKLNAIADLHPRNKPLPTE